MSELRQFIEIEFIKSMTPEEINTAMNSFKQRIDDKDARIKELEQGMHAFFEGAEYNEFHNLCFSDRDTMLRLGRLTAARAKDIVLQRDTFKEMALALAVTHSRLSREQALDMLEEGLDNARQLKTR